MKQLLKSDQVYELIFSKIYSGELPAGCKLPPEKNLAKQLGVGCRTLRTALARLEDNQLIIRLRKQGTFVAGGKEKIEKMEFPKIPEQPNIQRNFKHKILVIYREGASDSSAGIIRNIEKYTASLDIEIVEVPIDFLASGKLENRIKWLKKQYFSAVIIPFHGFGTDSFLIKLPDILHVPVIIPFGMEILNAYDNFFILPAMTRTAVFRALYYLYNKGHRKIGIIGFMKENRVAHLHNVNEHELSFLCTDGFPIIENAEEESESVRAALERLLAREKNLTAIFCYNDFMAATVMEHLQELGKNVPEDVSVMGYAASKVTRFVNPPLTSVSLFMDERVKKSVDFILSGDYRKEKFLPVPPQVIERGSVKDINKK